MCVVDFDISLRSETLLCTTKNYRNNVLGQRAREGVYTRLLSPTSFRVSSSRLASSDSLHTDDSDELVEVLDTLAVRLNRAGLAVTAKEAAV